MDIRLPKGQALTAGGKWPVVGETAPRADEAPWTVSVGGLVARPRTWTLDELADLPWVERPVDIHCVTRWTKPAARFGGVPLTALIEACEPLPEARFVSFLARSERGHSTSLPLADALGLGALVALTQGGEPLPEVHGGPVRTVVPERYFYKSLKWLERIELLAEDRLGFWEAEAGYHNTADPWREQRFMAADLVRREVRRLLAAKDFSGRELRGVDAARHDLAGLKAERAILRDAHFEGARLAGARFDGANLANAHFAGADLAAASFRGADVEGADFRGADLAGADFSGASLFGATFRPEPTDPGQGEPARLDATTRIDREQLSSLSEAQQAFLESELFR